MIGKDGRVITGLKGKSGRKPMNYERVKRDAIDRAWNKVIRDIYKFPAKDIALPIVLKDMADKQEIKGNMTVEKITGMVIEKVEYIDGITETNQLPEGRELKFDDNQIQNQNSEASTGSRVLD